MMNESSMESMPMMDAMIKDVVSKEMADLNTVVSSAVQSELVGLGEIVSIAVDQALAESPAATTESGSNDVLVWITAILGVIAILSSAYAVRSARRQQT